MKLYLVRHGIAVDVGEQGVTCDEDRMLSAEGRDKTRLAATGAVAVGVQPQVIGSSPLVRAWQTAEIFAAVLKPADAIVQTCPFMAFGGEDSPFFEWLAGRAQQDVMVVVHLPVMVFKTHACVRDGSGVPAGYKKAAIACISFEGDPKPRSGTFEWMMPPKQLREIASNRQRERSR